MRRKHISLTIFGRYDAEVIIREKSWAVGIAVSKLDNHCVSINANITDSRKHTFRS